MASSMAPSQTKIRRGEISGISRRQSGTLTKLHVTFTIITE
uniref:Uncharacterized protein n=1 Tax=Arundo donax TaxID=35708 RepID=A0A0A9HEB4_ARUDO